MNMSIIDQILDRYAFVQSVNIDTYLDLPITVTEPEFRAAITEAWDKGYQAALMQVKGLTGPVQNPYLGDNP